MTGFFSGYGVVETMKFLDVYSEGEPLKVVTKDDEGNPKSALRVSLRDIEKMSMVWWMDVSGE